MNKRPYQYFGIAFLFLALAIPSFAAHRSQENPEAFTMTAANGYIPAWSSDGNVIVYGSTGPPFNVFKVRLSDLRVDQLTQNGGFHPAVSPDRKFITYDSRGAMGTLHMIHFNDGSPASLTKNTPAGNFSCWSPDGQFIVYSNKGDLWQLHLKSGEVRLFHASEADDTRPAFSPDGSKVAFDSGDPQQRGNTDIFVLEIESKNIIQLTDHPKIDAQPHWSPDGRWITYMSEQSGNRDIWIMRTDGTQKTRLTYDPGMDVWPRWSPNGKKIAFGSQRQAKDKKAFDIWVIDLAKQLRVDFFDTD